MELIINLYKTVAKLDEASQALKKSQPLKKILFVATTAKDIVSESSKRLTYLLKDGLRNVQIL